MKLDELREQAPPEWAAWAENSINHRLAVLEQGIKRLSTRGSIPQPVRDFLIQRYKAAQQALRNEL